MKRRYLYLCFLTALLCAAFALTACGADIPSATPTVRVVVVDGEHFTGSGVYSTVRGGDLVLSLDVADPYEFDTCDYADYSFAKHNGRTVLTLRDLRYSVRVNISLRRIETDGIRYFLNGGRFLDGSRTGGHFDEAVSFESHLRANTALGTDTIFRDGYTQIGWNTRADGSGEHVGSGSRVTVPENGVELYAEWKKWTDSAMFACESDGEGGVKLTSFLGTDIAEVVLPAQIEGRPVTCIAAGFADKLRLTTMVFPPTLLTVEDGAFGSGVIGHLYFFDNLTEIGDRAFGRWFAIGRIHINAVLKPRFLADIDHGQFADKMDRLILNADKKKMVFFAGCSMSYGLDSPLAEAAFGGEYVICNMGVIGSTSATFQLDCISEYIGRGDVFVHAPEEMSMYQLLYLNAADTRMFMMAEGNYDLLALADLRGVAGIWHAYAMYTALRLETPEGSYDDRNPRFNAYGDFCVERPGSAANAAYGTTPLFNMSVLEEGTVTFGRMNSYYGRIEAKGAEAFFSFAPLNKNALSDQEKNGRTWRFFQSKIKSGLDPGFDVISDIDDYLMEGRYFYDTDYHLSSEGAVVRTEMLVRDIKAALAAQGDGK